MSQHNDLVVYPPTPNYYARPGYSYVPGQHVQLATALEHQERFQGATVTIAFPESGSTERYCCQNPDGSHDTYGVWQLKALPREDNQHDSAGIQ